MKQYIIGVDVGGTNTDSVLVDASNMQIVSKKKAQTTPDVTSGIKNSIQANLASSPIKIEQSQVIAVIIGTTHFINAIIQKGDKNTAEKLSRVAVMRLCGTQSYDFYPFCQIQNEDLLSRIQGPSYILNGGYTFDGSKEYTEMNEQEVIDCTNDLMNKDIHNLVISGIYSNTRPDQEIKAKELVLNECKKRNYNLSISLTHQVSKRDGIFERENASIVNECLKYLSFTTFQGYRAALDSLGFVNTPICISSNDGSFMPVSVAQENPIYTFSASIINSLKGGSKLYNEQDAIVVDIGGTSTDIAVISKGIPRTASKYMEVNGITLNFRMPLVHTIALGGGSIVDISRDEENKVQVKIRKESVAFKLLESAISCEGGTVVCNTDFAIYRNPQLEASIPGASRNRFIKHLESKGFNQNEIHEIANKHREQLTELLLGEIESLITDSSQKQKVLLVGGGACLVDNDYLEKQSDNVCQVTKLQPDQDVANALGATLTDITESHEELKAVLPTDPLEPIIEDIKNKLFQSLRNQGGHDPFEIVEIITNEAPYQANTKQIYMKVKGQFPWDKFPDRYRQNAQLNLTHLVNPSTSKNTHTREVNFSFPKPVVPKLNTDTGKWKPALVINNIEEFENLAWGCAILGSGGGGSVEKSFLIAKRLFKERNKPIVIYDPTSLTDEDQICMVAHFGAPTIFTECGFQVYELYSAFKALNQMSDKKINCLGCGEVGGLNGLSCILLALTTNMPVFDCSLMSRAFPEFSQTLPVIHKKNPLPMVLADSLDHRFIIDSFHFSNPPKHSEYQKIEEIMRDWLIKYLGMMISISSNSCGKQEVLQDWFLNGYQQAFKIGEILRQGILKQQIPVNRVIDEQLSQIIPHTRVLITGKIIHSERVKKGGYDFGKVIIKGYDHYNQDKSEKLIKLLLKNEFLYAQETEFDQNTKTYISGKPIAMTPDIITVVDEHKGNVVHSEDICYGLRVVVLSVPVDNKYRSPQALACVGPDKLGIGIEEGYKSYYD